MTANKPPGKPRTPRNTDSTRPRVAFYTRISTDEDHQKYSLDAQKDRLEAFCKAQWGDEWTLHKMYRDTPIAAPTWTARPCKNCSKTPTTAQVFAERITACFI